MTQPRSSLLRRFWSGYLHVHTPWILVSLVLMIIEGSALGALSYLLKPLFDTVFTANGASALYLVGFAILGLFVLRAFTTVTSRTLIAVISQKVSAVMQADLLRHILTLDGQFFQEHSPGVLIERVQGDTLAVQGIWSTLLTGIGRDLLGMVALFNDMQSLLALVYDRETGAMRLLLTDASIATIGQSCGFSDQSAFARQFKHTVGMSPRDYRAMATS